MKDKRECYNLLMALNGQEPSAYEKLTGDFDFVRYVLRVQQVEADAIEIPTLFLVRVAQAVAGFPLHLFNTALRRTALEDYLTRQLAAQIESRHRTHPAGMALHYLQVAVPGQKILPRTALLVSDEYVEARVYIQLPLNNGGIDSERLKQLLFDELNAIVDRSLLYCNLDGAEIESFVNLMEDADQIRQILPTRGLVAFAREGSLLPRWEDTDAPDYGAQCPLTCDETLRIEIEVPNAGIIQGVGVGDGITVILGDVFSGRIEFMRSLAAGIYNHIPGDGREWVVSVPDAVQLVAEPERSVQQVDLHPFGEPQSQPFSAHVTDGYISQAAATVEALEIGARALLVDESSSAPSFLAHDMRLQALWAAAADKTARPRCLAELARAMADELGLSLVVAGESNVAEFLAVADTVLLIENYHVKDVTTEAKALAVTSPAAETEPLNLSTLINQNRWLVPSCLDAGEGPREAVIEALAVDWLKYGPNLVSLRQCTQLADRYQTLTIGVILNYVRQRYLDEGRPIREIMDLIDRDLGTEGLECLSRDVRGDLARPRRYEIAAALNRMESLRISHVDHSD